MTTNTTNRKLDMELDDILKESRSHRRGGFRGNRRYNPSRRVNNKGLRVESKRRLIVENLNKDIQNAELNNLFKEFGTLTRCGIRFDKVGTSRGIADIEFSTHEEAQKAIDKLNNAEIGGVKVTIKYAANRINRSRISHAVRRSSSRGTKRGSFSRRTQTRRPRSLGYSTRKVGSTRRRVSTRRPRTSSRRVGVRSKTRRTTTARRIVFKKSLGVRKGKRTTRH